MFCGNTRRVIGRNFSEIAFEMKREEGNEKEMGYIHLLVYLTIKSAKGFI